MTRLKVSENHNYLKASLIEAIGIITKAASPYHRPAERLKDIGELVAYATDRQHVDIQRILDKYRISLNEN